MNKTQLQKVRDALWLPENSTDEEFAQFSEAFAILDAALAAPEQEPVAWATFDGEGSYDLRLYECNENYRDDYLKRNGDKYAGWVEPLYRHPATQSQPVARVTGYYAGRCVIEPLDGKSVFPTGMAVYSAPVAAQAAQEPVASISKSGLEMITKEGFKYATMRSLKAAAEHPTECDVLLYTAQPVAWQPIETAPHDNKRSLYLARIDEDGELVELDFGGAWEYWQESWEMAHINEWDWVSARGIEDPTHWAYQDEPLPTTAPPSREWQSLTDEEIDDWKKTLATYSISRWCIHGSHEIHMFARAIEDAVWRKNYA